MTKKTHSLKSYSIKFPDAYSSAFTVQMTAPVWTVKGSDAFFAQSMLNQKDTENQEDSKN